MVAPVQIPGTVPSCRPAQIEIVGIEKTAQTQAACALQALHEEINRTVVRKKLDKNEINVKNSNIVPKLGF
jgi:hypothetical protein